LNGCYVALPPMTRRTLTSIASLAGGHGVGGSP